MSEQASSAKPRCGVCGGPPAWICPDAKVVLCEGCLIRPGLLGGIDHLIPGSPRKCAHIANTRQGQPRTVPYMP